LLPSGCCCEEAGDPGSPTLQVSNRFDGPIHAPAFVAAVADSPHAIQPGSRPDERIRGPAPPHTLTAQHTSLLL
jgi:hypothetical protein